MIIEGLFVCALAFLVYSIIVSVGGAVAAFVWDVIENGWTPVLCLIGRHDPVPCKMSLNTRCQRCDRLLGRI
jgi:hypothetical protein